MSLAHPFLADDFHIKWSTLTPDHIVPDVRLAIENGKKNIAQIKTISPDEATFENTFLALEEATKDLNQAWGLVNHLDSVANSDPLREALNKVLPEVSEFSSSISLDDELWAVLKDFSVSEAVNSLSDIQNRFIDETCADFIQAGADLDPDAKKRMFEINAELAQITQKFSENVLDTTNAWEHYVTDESELSGLPEDAKETAAEAAKAKGKEGQWRFTQQHPSMFPVLQYADSESLRKTVWQGSCTIGYTEEKDNAQLVWDILQLRSEKAKLLGFANFCDLVLQRRMAKSGENAHQFIEGLHDQIVDAFEKEAEELKAYKAQKTDSENSLLEPWETGYWAEKQRQELYDFDEELLRPFFPVDQVMKGLFDLTSKIFGISIREVEAETWHEEVSFYEIHDQKSDEHLGSFYADWHPRESKRGGAWMNYFKTGTPHPRTPHLGLVTGNMTKPTADKPALLTHREVETIFHEFGHLLHHLLSEVEIKSLSGVNVPWDFVELPSQIMENFCWDRDSLNLFAKHYQTGENIPEDLLKKMSAARNYRSATGFMNQLAMGKIDLTLHLHPQKFIGSDIDKISREILASYRTELATESPTVLRRFNHLFSSPVAYASGYYSYKWAEVLDADAFTRFRNEGILSEETGRSFRNEILAKGNSRPVDESYQKFMERPPEQEALLERAGLA